MARPQGGEPVVSTPEREVAPPQAGWLAAWRGGTHPSDRGTFVSLALQAPAVQAVVSVVGPAAFLIGSGRADARA